MLRKIQFFQNIVAQNTGTFVAQNTDFSRNCCAKYRTGYCANYNLATKMLCKIQEFLLHKIQISPEIVVQNAGPDVAFRLRKLQMLRKIQ